MRYLEIMTESQGMNAVKAALNQKLDTGSRDETLIDQWSIMDELRLHRGVQLIVRYIYVDGQEVQSLWIGKTLAA